MTDYNYRFIRGDTNAELVTLQSWPKGALAYAASCFGHGVKVETMKAQECRALRDGLLAKFGAADANVKILGIALVTINALKPTAGLES